MAQERLEPTVHLVVSKKIKQRNQIKKVGKKINYEELTNAYPTGNNQITKSVTWLRCKFRHRCARHSRFLIFLFRPRIVLARHSTPHLQTIVNSRFADSPEPDVVTKPTTLKWRRMGKRNLSPAAFVQSGWSNANFAKREKQKEEKKTFPLEVRRWTPTPGGWQRRRKCIPRGWGDAELPGPITYCHQSPCPRKTTDISILAQSDARHVVMAPNKNRA